MEQSKLISFIKHLENLGYTVCEHKEHYEAEYSSKIGFSFTDYGNGINLYCCFKASDFANNNKLKSLEILNELTFGSNLAYFVMAQESIIISYWMIGKHNKSDFNNVLDLWEFDLYYAFNECPGFLDLLNQG